MTYIVSLPLLARARNRKLRGLLGLGIVGLLTGACRNIPDDFSEPWGPDDAGPVAPAPGARDGGLDGGAPSPARDAAAITPHDSGASSLDASAASPDAGGSDAGEPGCSAVLADVSINDGTTGTGLDQLDFQGDWSSSNGAGKYQDDDHYAAAADATASVRFRGVKASLYGARASHHGIVALSVDGEPETELDLYATTRDESASVWTSASLTDAEHVLKIRVTGRKNAASSGTTVAIDRLVVTRSAGCNDAGARPGDAGARDGGSADAGAGDAGNGGGDAGAAGARETMYVSGRYLYTACGEKIVLRGVNHPTIFVDRVGEAIPEIAKTKANAVRLFWFAAIGNEAITRADEVVTATIANGMVPILEMHDATGPSNWGQMPAIISYLTSPAAVAFIKKHQARLIVNIANEAGPNAGQDYAGYESVYKNAISSLRNAGIKVPLMIDASGWGRHVEILFNKGPALISHDPLHNILLSGHLYDVMSRQELAAVYQRSIDQNLPFLVGEFANRSPSNGCGPALDYLALIGEAQPREIGWLAWSWGDKDAATWWNSDCGEFDMTTTFSFDTLERWGKEVAVSNAASLTNTAVRPASFASGTCR